MAVFPTECNEASWGGVQAAAAVAAVEGEMRELLRTLDQHKHQSALKVKQLGALVQDLMQQS